jgi:hypothetical protein
LSEARSAAVRFSAVLLDIRIQGADQSLGDRRVVNLAALKPFQMNPGVIEIGVLYLEVE